MLKNIYNFFKTLVEIILWRELYDIFKGSKHNETDNASNLFKLFCSIGFYSVLILYYPIHLVFSGEWELNQKFSLGEVSGFGLIEIRFYALTMLLGMIFGYHLSLKLAKIRGIADTVVDRLFVGLVVFGLLGARAFYILFNLDDFSDNWLSVFEIYKGGLAVFGMIFAGVAYSVWYCWRYKFNFWLFSDFIVPGVLLGQILGRFGNFFNYESYGYPTKAWWAMHIPDSANLEFLTSRTFHPTFLYEIIPNFILLLIILKNYRNLTQKHAGLVLASYMIGYGFIRSLIEPLRVDPLLIQLNDFAISGELNIRVSLVSAILLAMGGIYIWIHRSKIYVKYQTITEIKFK